MSKLRQISIRTRFLLVMTLVTAALVVVGVWGWASTASSISTVSRLFDQATAASAAAGSLRESLSALRRFEAAMIAQAVSNPSEVETYFAQWKARLADFKKSGQALLEASNQAADIAALVDKQQKLAGEYADVITPIAEKLQAAQMDASAALAYASTADDTVKELQATSEALQQAQLANEAATRAQLADGMALASRLRLALVGGVLAIFLPLMALTLRSVCGPLDEAVALARRIAQGDLSTPPPVSGRDETARLLSALGDMQSHLRRLVGQVREAASSIQLASAEVASGNTDLSQRTASTAASLQRAAASMQQLSGTVGSSAESAQVASRLAGKAAEVASRGGAMVAQVVTTMQDIDASSKRIANIIGTIDGIAFQTNILALNAAVEAARAGEQGRGFAVVAGEVRALAQRSSEAAREIKDLIGNSVEKVGNGARLVSEAGTTMGEIVDGVRRVAELIGEISDAAGAQSGDIGQVHATVQQLDASTQQNSALVEQSAGAAMSLRQQAERLTSVVATFRLEAGAGPALA
ncbi:methyl-accepting chemotaxis protein [Azohydromonas lata]|uniref:Methyl-accepting chemotaxis protein n=2 Tax=Azohydromonas lata TaxID=45677 RepID=A0ABU5IEW5_9BURK|nr:methyl-accepting chemotaxis protein [Azohydromonas lata]MDZ5457631.1 methyl-accepting chemotaxis protein [Azohydromonas lata]